MGFTNGNHQLLQWWRRHPIFSYWFSIYLPQILRASWGVFLSVELWSESHESPEPEPFWGILWANINWLMVATLVTIDFLPPKNRGFTHHWLGMPPMISGYPLISKHGLLEKKRHFVRWFSQLYLSIYRFFPSHIWCWRLHISFIVYILYRFSLPIPWSPLKSGVLYPLHLDILLMGFQEIPHLASRGKPLSLTKHPQQDPDFSKLEAITVPASMGLGSLAKNHPFWKKSPNFYR